jgi:hypothetical protein
MNNKIRIKWRLVVVALLIIMIFPGSLLIQTSMAADIPMINYKVYYENYGWSNYNSIRSDTFECTHNKLEAIMFDDEDDFAAILSSVYIENDGWTPFMESGEAIGKISRDMPIKSIKIKFDNNLSKKYDIMYRVCYKDNTWTKWYSNGEKTGIDYIKDIYNIEIRVVKK